MRVAVYDDRIEIENAGYFLPGITIDSIISGTSRIRNPMIARVFRELNLIEQWGSGIPKIFKQITDFGLRQPTFSEFSARIGFMLMVNMNEMAGVNVGDVTENVTDADANDGNVTGNVAEGLCEKLGEGLGEKLSENNKAIIDCMVKESFITIPEIAQRLKISETTVQNNIKKLKNLKIIERVGADKGGYWRVAGVTNVDKNNMERLDEKLDVRLGAKRGETLGEKLSKNNKAIIDCMVKESFITIPEIAQKVKVSETAVQNNIKKLKKMKLIERIGPDKGGHWKVNT